MCCGVDIEALRHTLHSVGAIITMATTWGFPNIRGPVPETFIIVYRSILLRTLNYENLQDDSKIAFAFR